MEKLNRANHRMEQKRMGRNLSIFRRKLQITNQQPGCGSKSLEPGIFEKLEVKFGGFEFTSRI